MNDFPFTNDEIAEDLWRLSQVGLVDVCMGVDGQWRYKVSDLYRSLSADEIDNLISKSQELEFPL